VARHIDCGDLLLQVALVPESPYRYVFPIVSDLPSYLIRPENPYLDSAIYEWVVRTQSSGAAPAQTTTTEAPAASVPPLSLSDLYMKPYHAAEVVDAQLSAVQPSRWTTACTDDDLMRQLLARYLMVEYGGLTCFHKEYFLQDMARMRHKLCSPLLVNAVLALACVCLRRLKIWPRKTTNTAFCSSTSRDSRTAPNFGTHQASASGSWRKPGDYGKLSRSSTS